jgi:flagellar motor protein MotB
MLFAMFAMQRRKAIEIEQPMRDFVQNLGVELRRRGIPVVEDIDRSAIVLPEGVLFKSTQWTLEPGRTTRIAGALRSAASKTSGLQNLQLVIRGHADARPVPSVTGFDNLHLSRLRARSMEEELVATGLGSLVHMSSEGVGANEPIVDNCAAPAPDKIPRAICPDGKFGTADALERNRRIELRFGFFSGQTVRQSRGNSSLSPR